MAEEINSSALYITKLHSTKPHGTLQRKMFQHSSFNFILIFKEKNFDRGCFVLNNLCPKPDINRLERTSLYSTRHYNTAA